MAQLHERLPAFVGGYPIKIDLIPSIVCSACHALLLPIFAYRFFHKISRTTVFMPTMGLIVERSVMFGLRAAVSLGSRSEDGLTNSEGSLEYIQTTLTMGVIPIAQDLSLLVRTLLVNATYGPDAAKEMPRLQEYLSHSASDPEINSGEKTSAEGGSETRPRKRSICTDGEPEEYPDQPRLRFWFRRMHDCMNFLFITATVTGLVGNTSLIPQRHNAQKVKVNQILRYVSASIIIAILLAMVGALIRARHTFPRLNKRATYYIFGIAALLLIPAIYRLIIMSQYTSAVYSFEPSAQNHRSAKILFYFVNVLPEWLAVLINFSTNTRKLFRTGLEGDQQCKDETPEEKEKRLMKEEKKKLKKEQRRQKRNHSLEPPTLPS